jgi:hypothetical protein
MMNSSIDSREAAWLSKSKQEMAIYYKQYAIKREILLSLNLAAGRICTGDVEPDPRRCHGSGEGIY